MLINFFIKSLVRGSQVKKNLNFCELSFVNFNVICEKAILETCEALSGSERRGCCSTAKYCYLSCFAILRSKFNSS